MSVSRALNRAGLTACLFILGTLGVQHAKAVGDTRTITLHHVHTNEDLTITYKKNGQYDDEALNKINWIMRDWRKNEATKMDPQEIDLLWEVYQEVGAKEAIYVVCGYRSSNTNEMLRGRSKNSGVARHSQHTLGKAIDFYIPGVPLDKLRATAMKMQGGGVGYYPTSGSPFVHLDVGNVRAWPRMTREQLVKLFPDGRTVHLPTDGKPLPGYELALADVERGHHTVATPQKRNFFASLFSRDKDAEESDDNSSARDTAAAPRGVTAKTETKPEPAKSEQAKPAARYQVASAAETTPVPAPASTSMPMPPRRPTFQLAAMESKPELRPATPVNLASLSPNQIVSMRGLWDDADTQPPAPAMVAIAETNALSVSSQRRLPPAGRDVTASVGPFPTSDRVPTDVALAYAALADGAKAQAAAAKSNERAPAVVTNRGAASIASKPGEIVTSQTRAAENFDNPWTRGVLLTASVQNSLVVTPVGDTDFAGLARFMTKPVSAVLMTFSNDPHLGMTTAQFTGSAVVFPATTTFGALRRSASLQ